MDLARKIRETALNSEMDYVGIAPVERFNNAPNGHRPHDILPGAKSVISMGVSIGAGAQLTQRVALTNGRLRHVSFSYRWFGYGLLNMYFLDRIALLVAKQLETEGYMAVPIVASGVEDIKRLTALFSNRHAAVAAGIGEIGWNGLCLTPENGPRQRFVSVITTANLEPDSMYEGPRLCNPEKCREIGGGVPVCLRYCPASLFRTGKTVKAVIADRQYEYAVMDHQKCAFVGSGLDSSVFGTAKCMPAKVDFEITLAVMANLSANNLFERMVYGRGSACGACLLRCPIGMRNDVDSIMKSLGED